MIKDKQPRLITLAILTTVTCVFWVFFSVIRALTVAGTEVNVSQEILRPLNPTLDTETLNRIRDGLEFTNSDIIESSGLELELSEVAREDDDPGVPDESEDNLSEEDSDLP